MTSRTAVLGFIFPLVLMSFCLLYFLLPDNLLFPFSFVQLLLIFAYLCIMSFLSKKKSLIMEFECAYLVFAVPFILGFLYAIVLNIQELEIPFLKESILFDNLAFYLFIGGFVSAIDVGGTIRLFYDGAFGFIPLVFIVTAILLITPLLIRKFTNPTKNIQEKRYGN